jgi:hypothetical protein
MSRGTSGRVDRLPSVLLGRLGAVDTGCGEGRQLPSPSRDDAAGLYVQTNVHGYGQTAEGTVCLDNDNAMYYVEHNGDSGATWFYFQNRICHNPNGDKGQFRHTTRWMGVTYGFVKDRDSNCQAMSPNETKLAFDKGTTVCFVPLPVGTFECVDAQRRSHTFQTPWRAELGSREDAAAEVALKTD